ncbi:MAG: HisA/HisF-related TIM barrel protein, partial [Methanomassiliicoccales archaeon]
MIVIPAIDLMGGNVVQLVGGVPGTERVMLPDPVAVAKSWEKKGAPALHLIDLDAAMEKGTNFQIIKEILKNTSIPVQVGGGVRSEELIRNLIAAGAARIIVGTRGILDRDWLSRMVNRYPNKIMLAIDIKYGKVLVKGWREPTGVSIDRLFSEISVLPLAGVLYTNVDIEGRTSGIDVLKTKEFILRCPHP